MPNAVIPTNPRFKNLTGHRFGRLVVESVWGRSPRNNVIWRCKCDCGNYTNVLGSSLIQGRTKSCWCLHRDTRGKNATHRKTNSPEYHAWASMKGRCTNPSNTDWEYYGGRGITMCESWNHFENFLADMGPRPKGTSIDRIDNSKGYYPENCRWATAKQQGRNSRRNRLVTFRGETKCLREWAELLNVPYQRVLARLNLGWNPERALTQACFGRGNYRALFPPHE